MSIEGEQCHNHKNKGLCWKNRHIHPEIQEPYACKYLLFQHHPKDRTRNDKRESRKRQQKRRLRGYFISADDPTILLCTVIDADNRLKGTHQAKDGGE